jgi:tetratricopeptide (TPR) repeat protein
MGWLRRLVGGDEPVTGKPGVESVRFDLPGWKRKRTSSEAAEWRDGGGDILQVRFADQPAPLLSESSDIASLREHYRREAAASGGGIVSVDALTIHGVPGVEAIKKFERRPAYSYQGMLALGFESSHCVFAIESLERGTTGVREAVVTSHLFERGELEIREEPGAASGELVGWFLDPYLASYDGPILHSLSDDERLDGLFSQHPLARIRRVLARIAETLSFDPALRPAKAAHGDRPERAKRPLRAATVATLYAKAGRSEEAVAILHEWMRHAEIAQGAQGRDVADAAMELGRLYLMQGDAAQAQALLQRAAALREASGDRRGLADALLLLGFACEGQATPDAAEAALRKAMGALDGSSPEDPVRAQVVLNLGRMCVSQRKAAEAEPLFEEALRVFAKEDRARGSNAAVALNGLGLVRNEQGRYSDAIPLFEKALSGFEAAHGPDFPDVATVLGNMAFSWQKLGDERKARELLARAARIPRP